MADRDVNTHGVVNVDARENVDTWIDAPESRYQITEDVLIRIDHRTEIRSVREQGADEKTDRHSCEKEGAEPVIVIAVFKEEKRDGRGNVQKPHQVRDDKIFVERDQIVERRVHDVVRLVHIFLES